jgi:transposase-like protein
MSKYTKQFKLQVIEYYLQENAGYALVARQFGELAFELTHRIYKNKGEMKK